MSMEFPKINFIKYHKIALLISCLLILFSLIGLVTKGLNLGIDFTGGLLFELEISNENRDLAKVRQYFSDNNFKNINIQSFGEKGLMIRVSQEEITKKLGIANATREQITYAVKDILNKLFNENIVYNKIDFVGPQIGSELIKNGILALFLSFIGIMFYLWNRFEWQFGLGGVLCLIHDAILTIGFFVWTGLEFDLTSIAAILTIVGYSINDSVVIYDRIREYLPKFYKQKNIEEILNLSLNSTLSRTIYTTTTVILALIALIIWGGSVLHGFSIAILFGLFIGTYSTIYIAIPILIYLKIQNLYKKK